MKAHTPVVSLPAKVRRAMIGHARREAPLECCGLLVGRGARVVAAVPMRNLARSRTRFRLDDRAHIELRRVLRSVVPPVEIIGLYHSHPRGPAAPSKTDVAEAHYAEWVHVVVSLEHLRASLQAFRFAQGRVTRIGMRS